MSAGTRTATPTISSRRGQNQPPMLPIPSIMSLGSFAIRKIKPIAVMKRPEKKETPSNL